MDSSTMDNEIEALAADLASVQEQDLALPLHMPSLPSQREQWEREQLLQEIRDRERDMELIQAQLTALKTKSKSKKRKREASAEAVPALRTQDDAEEGREREEIMDGCLNLAASVLGISFSHVSSSLLPNSDGKIIKQYDMRGKAGTLPFLLLLHMQEEKRGEGELVGNEHAINAKVRVPVAFEDQLRPLVIMLEERLDVQLFLNRLAEFAELAEAREALWRDLKQKYSAYITLPKGFASTCLRITPLQNAPGLQLFFLWDIQITEEFDVRSVMDMVLNCSFTLPAELDWLKDTPKHFRTLAARKGLQDALETIISLASR